MGDIAARHAAVVETQKVRPGLHSMHLPRKPMRDLARAELPVTTFHHLPWGYRPRDRVRG